MPISSYFKGEGTKVMAKMKKQYGAKADEVFYATANKHPMFKPDSDMKKSMRTAAKRGRLLSSEVRGTKQS